MSTAVIADRYPANVTCPDGTVLRNVRAILTRDEGDTPGQLYVYADNRPEPRLAVRARWTFSETRLPHGRAPWKVTTDDGQFGVERGRGCGCGSPLRRWKPWAGYRLTGMPPEVQR